MADVIFDDMFMVKNIDPDGKNMELILDVNAQIYPVSLNDKFRLMITTSVRDDGMPDEGEHDPQANYSRVAQFEYVMFGRVCRIEGDDSRSDGTPYCCVCVLRKLIDETERRGMVFNLHGFGLGSNVYLLIKKAEF
ncbi:unnamed protein product [Angiostrongylus costaricensis]|uniref:DNA-directed RNA polymerases I, II, and III subunit RPABC3 n=1 Tax=Angiostrongylus costaricensis TaxID=334426 RepID=A0A0R3PEN7_ANGCS|nr:unnamed protein product [Angiostrongylus costaricensis]